MTSGPAFEATEIMYRYRSHTALSGLSIRIDFGTRVALLGANGSGKSTLLRVLAGLYFPASGTLRFRGREMTEQDFLHDEFAHAFRKNVGLVFQDPDVQLFCPSVFDEIAFGPLQLGLTRQQVLEGVEKALDVFGIEHLRYRSPHQLSGGEKKQVALASVLVMDPAVLLLDEPTAALDPRTQLRIASLLERWHTADRAMIVATHDLEFASRMADECVVLDRGHVLARGPIGPILNDAELLKQANLA